jgi:hypothetical protein
MDNNSVEHHLLDYESTSKEVKNTAASEFQIVQTEDSESLNFKLLGVEPEHSVS